MIVVCIDNSGIPSLTLGKLYTASTNYPKNWKRGFMITNDSGIYTFYFKWRFIPLEEHRQNILNNLGI
jgi:hypothetical protein